MLLIRILIVIALFAALSRPASAQLSLPSYLPSACVTSARNSFPGQTDGRIVAVVAVGVEFDLGIATVFLGMNMNDGKAPMWAYRVYSPTADSAIWAPLIRPLGSCTAPPVDVPLDGSDLEGIGTTAIPATSIEGTAVVNAVKMNSEYIAFNTAHPDSVPLLTVLTVSTETFLTFPAGTPFWMLTWTGTQSQEEPFICLVQAENGQTMCFGGDVSGVHDEDIIAINAVFPNPATDVASLSVGPSAIGRSISIEAFSSSGERVVLSEAVTAVSQTFVVPTEKLSNGLWHIRITDATGASPLATTQLIIQR